MLTSSRLPGLQVMCARVGVSGSASCVKWHVSWKVHGQWELRNEYFKKGGVDVSAAGVMG